MRLPWHLTVVLLLTLSIALVAGSGLSERENQPPCWERATLPDGIQDHPYAYQLNATDPDDPIKVLGYSDDTELFEIGTNATIEFVPRSEHVGRHWFNVTVQDPWNNSDTMELSLFVANVNDPPTLMDIPAQHANEDELFQVDLSGYVEDPDLLLPPTMRDRIVYRDDTPKVSTDLETGVLVWRYPRQEDVGSLKVKLTVQDSKGRCAEQVLVIFVHNVNDPPELLPIPRNIVFQDMLFTYQVPCSDADLDCPSCEEGLWFSNRPTDLFVIDGYTGLVRFTPRNEHVGVWEVNISVVDKWGGTDWTIATVEVVNENDPPLLPHIPAQNVTEGTPFELQVNATDPDMLPRLLDGTPVDPDERLLYRTDSTRVAIDIDTGLVTFTPTNDDALEGSMTVRISVIDSVGHTDHLVVPFHVENVNDPPESVQILGIHDGQSVRTDGRYTLMGSATDIDDPPQHLSYTWLQDGGLVHVTQAFQWRPEGRGPSTLTLVVEDPHGANASASIRVLIDWIPPVPEILRPAAGQSFGTDERVIMVLEFGEEELPEGTFLEIGISSSETGHITTLPAETRMEVDLGPLESGNHVLRVTVTDGETESTAGVGVRVRELSTGGLSMVYLGLISLALFAIVVSLLLISRSKRSDGR